MANEIKWKDANFRWNAAPENTKLKRYTWNEVQLVYDAISVDTTWPTWEDEKKKRLIKLICKVKGKTYKETKEVQDIQITAKDIKLLAEKVLGIEVITENIKF